MIASRLPMPLAALLSLSLLGGCRSVPERPPPPSLDETAQFTVAIAATTDSDASTWWDSKLAADHRIWVERLLASNPSLRIGMAEVRERRARLQAAEAERGPRLDASAGASITRSDGDSTESVDAGVDASLPIDLSGQLRAEAEGRLWEYRQAFYRLQQVRLEQVESLLLALTDYAEARQRERLLDRQVRTTRKQLHLTEVRFSQGLVSSVDVLQQREQISSLEQQYPEVALNARLAMNQVSALLAQTPATGLALPTALADIPPDMPVRQPIHLLQRQPGLLAQQAALAAADADFEVALRARLPQLALSGSALWQLIAGNATAVVQAALDASLNLFDSGERSAEIARRRALLEIAGTRYLQDWLDAVRETDDLLNTRASLDRQLQLNRESRRIAQQLYQATLSRYQRGVSDYLPVLTALRDLQQQERETLRLRAERQRTLIRLQTAGGLPSSILERNREAQG